MYKIYPFILKNAIMPIADSIMNTKISYYYNLINKMEKWTEAEINNWQNIRLQNLVIHAYKNTSYYRTLFDESGIDPYSIVTKSDLNKIPVLSKDVIVKKFADFIPKNLYAFNYKKASTGGSTGDPLQFYLDLESWSFTNANYMYNWEKTSYEYGDKFIALGSTSLFVNESLSYKHKLYYRLKRKIGLNGVNMSDDVCERYVNIIKRNKVKYIYGYASAIYLLAKYVERMNLKLGIKVCFPTSEILTDLYRNTIIYVFNCEIVNCYGANDGGITAFEHKKGVFEVGYNTIVSIKEQEDKTIGQALLTDLLNYAFPLINYQVGDELELGKDNSLIFNGQIIKHVYGRTSDIIRLPNGNILTGPGFTILFKDLPVKAYKIIKDISNDIICEIIPGEGFTEKHKNIIFSTIQKQAGESIKIIIVCKDHFKLGKNGKINYFISK